MLSVLVPNLTSPFGNGARRQRSLHCEHRCARSCAVRRRHDARISAKPQRVAALPAGTINHHWTKNVVATPDGAKLYVSVGSNSNAGEKGIDKEDRRASILEIDPQSGTQRVFATGRQYGLAGERCIRFTHRDRGRARVGTRRTQVMTTYQQIPGPRVARISHYPWEESS